MSNDKSRQTATKTRAATEPENPWSVSYIPRTDSTTNDFNDVNVVVANIQQDNISTDDESYQQHLQQQDNNIIPRASNEIFDSINNQSDTEPHNDAAIPPPTPTKKHHKKSTKSFSTMFCEGYNIEQRNCNTFECSGKYEKLHSSIMT